MSESYTWTCDTCGTEYNLQFTRGDLESLPKEATADDIVHLFELPLDPDVITNSAPLAKEMLDIAVNVYTLYELNKKLVNNEDSNEDLRCGECGEKTSKEEIKEEFEGD